MKRKVTKMGPASLVVSLPSKWVKENRIKKGDELEVAESGKQLLIGIEGASKRIKSVTLDIPTPDKFFKRYLFSAYIRGADEIRVNYRDKAVFDLVAKKTQLLFGFEVVAHEQNYCVLRNISSGVEEDFSTIFNRLYISGLSMMDDLLVALKSNDFSALSFVKSMEDNNNKLTYLCLRILNLKGYKDPSRMTSIYYIIALIEQIVDDLREVCRYVLEKKLRTSATTHKIMFEIIDLYKQFYKLFHHFDATKVFEFNQQVNRCRKIFYEQIPAERKQAIVLSYMQSILEKVGHLVKEIHY